MLNRPSAFRAGDLQDPLYFDFISYAQYATIGRWAGSTGHTGKASGRRHRAHRASWEGRGGAQMAGCRWQGLRTRI